MPNSKPNNIKTLVIDKWNGRLTRFRDGDINSGLANYYTSWGYDTFEYNGTLTFSQGATDITKSVITDLIMAAKVRVENIGGNLTTFVYAIGHTGRIYKIQVNDPVGKTPDYDTPVLLATLANAQTFLYGGSIDFYQGVSEKIWIGHDAGITKINFDGTGETNLIGGSWITNVPRQSCQFLGSIFFTNGSNLAQVDSTEAVLSYAKLSPGFPLNTQTRDLRLTIDGRYMVAVVTRNALGNLTSTSPNISDIAAMPAYLIYWNGTDTASSAITSFPSFSLQSYFAFSSFEYIFGYNIGGFSFGTTKSVLVLPEFENAPLPNAIGSSGDFVGWMSILLNPFTGNTQSCLDLYGTIDAESPKGLYRQLIMSSTLSSGDVIRVPYFGAVSSVVGSGATAGYFNAITNPLGEIGSGKTYFSTLEYNGSATKYGFYMFKNSQDFLTASNTGVYETQHQIFSKKIKVSEYRVYLEPATALTSFTIDLIGIDGLVISGTTHTFSSITGLDIVQFTPAHAPTSTLGLRITNVGSSTPLIHKVEIDYTPYGQ